MAQRQYESATVFNNRIVDMRHLWTPSTEYKGQATQKPNYFGMFIIPKTVPQWFNEPALAGIAQACGKLFATNPHIVSWPVVDGDMPSPQGKSSDFAKGHWLYSASTGSQPNIELVQAGGQLVKLPNKVGVKSGDYCMTGVTAAVKQNDARGVKLYLNAVVFTAPGEEIVFANSVSGAELMRMAQAQGLQVAGFAGAPGGFAPGPQGGFLGAGAPMTAPQPFGAPQPGFSPPAGPQTGQMGAPGFSPPLGNPAPMAAPAAFPGAIPNGAPQPAFGGAASPSNGQFPGQR